LLRDDAQFEALLGTLRVLRASGQAAEARALTEHVSAALARRVPDRCLLGFSGFFGFLRPQCPC
jgi:hypothetical protein